MTGHVFVLQGDLMSLACDAWCVPGGNGPGHTWKRALAADRHVTYPPRWGERDGPRATPFDVQREAPHPEAFLTNITAEQQEAPAWYVQGAREFVRTAAAHVKGRAPFHRRARHLLALPLLGTKGGGGEHVSGDVVRLLLPALREEACAHDVDVALVLADGPAFTAAQNERRAAADAFAGLPPELVVQADLLADKAKRGDLVVFLGAGVSQGAGLPTWDALLLELAAEKAGLLDAHAFAALGELDRAALIERRLPAGETLGEAVAAHFLQRSTHHALCHGLLASLPVDEVVTTNYDDLFERASLAFGRPVTVLPGGQAVHGERWLLKMHGSVTRPSSIVLTREDYLRFQENRSALAGIVQALLLTRHMLFVGFSFTDDNFHRIAHAVRRALDHAEGTAPRARFGTTLVVNPNPLARELWHDAVDWIAFTGPAVTTTTQQARQLEVFLDRVACRAATATSHLFDRRYDALLTPAEHVLRERLEGVVAASSLEMRSTPAWQEVARMLRRLGAREE